MDDFVVQRSLYFARDMVNRYPSQTHFLLNFGVSTTPISLALRLLVPEDQQDRYFREVPVTNIYDVGANPREVNRILERLIPTEAVLQGRTLVFHRVLDQGHSLQNFLPFFHAFMAARRPEVNYCFHFMGREGASGGQFPSASRLQRRPMVGLVDDEFAYHLTQGQDRSSPSAWMYRGRTQPFEIGEAARPAFGMQPNVHYTAALRRFRSAAESLARDCQSHFMTFASLP